MIIHLLQKNLQFLMTCCQTTVKKIADEYGIKVGDAMKSIPKLGSKTNYVLHYRNLQLHLFLGMKLTKIHWMLKFKQSDWMKKYIDFNYEKEQMLLIALKKIFLN